MKQQKQNHDSSYVHPNDDGDVPDKVITTASTRLRCQHPFDESVLPNMYHSRRSVLASASSSSILLLQLLWSSSARPTYATVTDPKTGILQPEPGEIEAAVPTDWTTVDNPFVDGKNGVSSSTSTSSSSSSSLFGRLDQQPDSIFYETPRFVEHIDDNAVRVVTKYNTDVILSTTATKIVDSNGNAATTTASTTSPIRVLDLCSSWTSHIDPNVIIIPSEKNKINNDNGGDTTNNATTKNNNKVLAQVSGVGMNEEELRSNPLLCDWIVQDLNSNPDLSKTYHDERFDVVLCQLSIDYLTRPLEVLREMSRILKVGGTIHIIFSNRLFLSKAVALWAGADDIDHTYYVSSYLHFCGGNFQNIESQDLSTRSTKGRDRLIIGDPVFVVRAVKG